MSNSSLVSFTMISPFKNTPRNHNIDTITIHCVVGQLSVESMGRYFSAPTTNASANYGIGSDGRVGMYVEENSRSWCSSSPSNDNRAVTIECACDSFHPYKVNDDVLKSLILLVTDVCERNGIKELKWKGDKSLIGQIDKQNMTVHRWFKNKACPGEYLYNLHPYIADEVNKMLSKGQQTNNNPISDNSVQGVISKSGLVQVIYKGSDGVNVRKSPCIGNNVDQVVHDGTYTVVGISADGNWYKLKSGLFITTDTSLVKFYDSETPSVPVPQPVQKAERYVAGKIYEVCATNLRVREAPGENSRIKAKKELTPDGQKNADSLGRLNKGAVVTCLEIRYVGDNIWMRIPSGWIAARYFGNEYVR